MAILLTKELLSTFYPQLLRKVWVPLSLCQWPIIRGILIEDLEKL
jgi:hypothetical protein